MKIAITSTGPTLDAAVDARFGRCAYFMIVDTDTMQFEAVENTNAAASGGAGVQAAQLVADKDVQAVLTGNCGPKAFQGCAAADICVITGVSGVVSEVIERYKQGDFSDASAPNVNGHFGMPSN